VAKNAAANAPFELRRPSPPAKALQLAQVV